MRPISAIPDRSRLTAFARCAQQSCGSPLAARQPNSGTRRDLAVAKSPWDAGANGCAGPAGGRLGPVTVGRKRV